MTLSLPLGFPRPEEVKTELRYDYVTVLGPSICDMGQPGP